MQHGTWAIHQLLQLFTVTRVQRVPVVPGPFIMSACHQPSYVLPSDKYLILPVTTCQCLTARFRMNSCGCQSTLTLLCMHMELAMVNRPCVCSFFVSELRTLLAFITIATTIEKTTAKGKHIYGNHTALGLRRYIPIKKSSPKRTSAFQIHGNCFSQIVLKQRPSTKWSQSAISRVTCVIGAVVHE